MSFFFTLKKWDPIKCNVFGKEYCTFRGVLWQNLKNRISWFLKLTNHNWGVFLGFDLLDKLSRGFGGYFLFVLYFCWWKCNHIWFKMSGKVIWKHVICNFETFLILDSLRYSVLCNHVFDQFWHSRFHVCGSVFYFISCSSSVWRSERRN